jgi:hypothetical protein
VPQSCWKLLRDGVRKAVVDVEDDGVGETLADRQAGEDEDQDGKE